MPTSAASAGSEINSLDLLLILLVTVSWGLNYPIMKFVVTSYPPLTFRAFTFTIGFVLLGAYALRRGESLHIPVSERWLAFKLGMPNMVLWHVGLVYGISLLNSGRAAIIGYTMPVWALMASVLLYRAPRPPAGELWLEVLDVGQGLAVLVRTQHHSLLYDTGPYYSSAADAGVRVIVPYLRATGVDRLDGLVVTHRDTDHSGGAQSVLESMPVQWVADAPDTIFADQVPGVRTKRCVAGQDWIWNGVRFEFLYPHSARSAKDHRLDAA